MRRWEKIKKILMIVETKGGGKKRKEVVSLCDVFQTMLSQERFMDSAKTSNV